MRAFIVLLVASLCLGAAPSGGATRDLEDRRRLAKLYAELTAKRSELAALVEGSGHPPEGPARVAADQVLAAVDDVLGTVGPSGITRLGPAHRTAGIPRPGPTHARKEAMADAAGTPQDRSAIAPRDGHRVARTTAQASAAVITASAAAAAAIPYVGQVIAAILAVVEAIIQLVAEIAAKDLESAAAQREAEAGGAKLAPTPTDPSATAGTAEDSTGSKRIRRVPRP
ncbi:MAG: hypothetical protein CL910_12995 [Deltaproteobacteria bacterium]|jgi:hypothetical protein|nr:hypothetical protein [Deltaproteobacteria bacterium]